MSGENFRRKKDYCELKDTASKPSYHHDCTPRRKVVVTVSSCSNSQHPESHEHVAGLINRINNNMSDVVESVTFKSLPYNIDELNNFDFSGIDVLLLCHSIKNRGLSLTDVPNALYDGFIRRANENLGEKKIGVIAYDFESLSPEKITSKTNSLRRWQATTFANASLVLIAGQLNETQVGLNEEQIGELRQFFYIAASLPQEERVEVSNNWCCCC